MDVIATNIHSDAPIQGVSEDKFGRGALVELLAKSIQEKCKSDHDSICIGIYGKWGEGKTSFVNMLLDLLNTTYKSHNADIVLFNPWIVNSEEGLIREYFKRIITSPIGEPFKKTLIEYGGLIATAASEVGGELFPVLGPLVKASINATRKYLVSNDKSLEELKSNISDNLQCNREHLIVFIDDIDRLDCDEMHSVFRLVRQVADFKNTIYVLSLDEDRVAKSLGKYYGEGGEDDGRQFLEKIIQIPIVLPKIQAAHIKKSLKEAIIDIYRTVGLDPMENIDDIVNKIYLLFETQREVIRYRNQLLFFFPSAYTEVNHTDYFILEAIKVQNIPAYDKIRNNKSYFLKELPWSYDNTGRESDFTKLIEKEYNTVILDVCNLFPIHQKGDVKGILKYFLSCKGYSSIDDRNEKRLFNQFYFDRYFLHEAPENIIPDADVDRVNISNIVSISTWMEHRYSNYSLTEISGALMRMVRRKVPQSSQMANILIAISMSRVAKEVASRELCAEIIPTLTNDMLDSDYKRSISFLMEQSPIEYALTSLTFCAFDALKKQVDATSFYKMKERLLQIDCFNPFLYPGYIQRAFFCLWKHIDKDAFKKYVVESFNHKDFPSSRFLSCFMTSPQDMANLSNMVLIFGDTLHSYKEGLAWKPLSSMEKSVLTNYLPILNGTLDSTEEIL